MTTTLTIDAILKLTRTAATLRAQAAERGCPAERKALLINDATVAESAVFPHFATALHAAAKIVVSSSGGKDSQVLLHETVAACDAEGIDRSKIVVVHSDLGRVEWEGTKALAQRQAESYGIEFVVVSRIGGIATKSGKVYSKGEAFGDLLDYAERRGAFPDNSNRWCTSEFKRGPIAKLFTALAKDAKAAGVEPIILDLQGLRAEESVARSKKPVVKMRKDNKNQIVITWLPIIERLETEVWETIKSNGLESHRAYELGMPRLSCAFCIFAGRDALLISGRANPALLDEYVAVEERTGHTFQNGKSLGEIKQAIADGEQPKAGKVEWAQCG